MLLLLGCAPAPVVPVAVALDERDTAGIRGADVLWVDLRGQTRADLLLDCASHCPKEDLGLSVPSLTTWKVDWTWGRDGEPCRVVDPKVHVDVTVALPRWRPPFDADAALVAEWHHYVAALARHEQGHVDLVYAMAGISEARLAAGGCEGARLVARTMLAELRERQAAFDAYTHHGRNQGPSFFSRGGRRVAEVRTPLPALEPVITTLP